MSKKISWIGVTCGLGIATLLVGNASAQLTVSEEINPRFAALSTERELSFEQVPDLGPPSVEELINAAVVDRANFPTIFRMTTGGTCTAALVGPSAIATAAHCVDHGAEIRFVTDEFVVRGICERATGYVDDVSASEDFAMCLLDRSISGTLYESFDVNAMPSVGDTVHLTGYGCTQQGGGIDGQLRIGPATVIERPDVDWMPIETSTIYTGSTANLGEAVLCPGDSGGPLFKFFGNNYGDARVIVGLNSRTTYAYGVSLFAATGTRQGRLWLSYWADRHEIDVCGINREDGCF